MEKLLNKRVKIISDNENYNEYLDKILIVTHVAKSIEEHPGYDTGLNGEALCDFKVEKTNDEVPFSLYEYEFQVIN